MSGRLLRVSRIALVLLLASRAALAADYSLPDRVAVLPVAFVPRDEQPPTAEQKQVFLKHILWAQKRYGEMLGGDTFEISGKEVQVVRADKPLDFYRTANENGAPNVVSELLAHYQITRFKCPYVFCIMLMNSKDSFPMGGGRPINGGLNSGGGMMYIASFELKRNEHFQCTLQHELGHSFGLPHVDVYGYDMTANPSIMSYNPAHHNKGFEPSPTPGVLIPEDIRALALNDRVFAKTTFVPARDVPSIYPLSKKIVPLGPMQLPGQPEFYPHVTTKSGEEMGSKVGNVVQEEIKASAGPGFTYDPRTMWHSNRKLPEGKAVLDISFPMPVRLSAIGIHSQHSGLDHEATAMRLETADGARQKIVEQPLKSADEIVSFPATKAAAWSLTLTGGKEGTLVVRGIRFFDGDEEIFPHMIPYRDKPETQLAETTAAKPLSGDTAPVAPPVAVAKLPIPDAAAQLEARKAVKQTYQTEYSKAKKADDKIDLARTLVIQAAQPDKDEVRYVLLTEASDLAVAAGRLDVALEALQTLAGRFEVDALALKERAAAKINPTVVTSANSAPLLEKFSELATEAADAEEYALAAKVMQAAGEVFKRPTQKALRDQAVAQTKQYTALRDTFEAAKTSRDVLRSDPDNATANLAWGKFLCFFRQDWAGGLPLIAKGNDKTWAPLAERDLNPPKDINGLLQLGDDWLKAGEREKEPVKTGVRLRASQAWTAALASTPPALKGDVEQKLDSRVVKLFGPNIATTTGDAAGAAIPGSERFSPGELFTIEFWVSTKATRGTLISKKHTAADMTVLTHLNDGAANLGLAIGGGERGSGGGPAINDGRWHHVAIVKRGAEFKLFVDGQQVTSTSESKPLISNSPWKFGCSHSRPPCMARFGGARISSAARYTGPFTPQWLYAKDRDTLFPQ